MQSNARRLGLGVASGEVRMISHKFRKPWRGGGGVGYHFVNRVHGNNLKMKKKLNNVNILPDK